MIVYNVTIKIDLDAHDLWLRWMKEEHIARVLETGCFDDAKIFRVLEDKTDSMSRYFDYKAQHAPRLQKEGAEMFPGKFNVFRTILKEV